ncbi:MAG: hypothetical protein RLY86_132 [Pseudomonadota bacterium]|jgi:hypothetical protein
MDTLNALLPWVSVVVLPLAVWLLKLAQRVEVLAGALATSGTAAAQSETRLKAAEAALALVPTQLHALEKELRAEMVTTDQLTAMEARIEKRMDRYETKLDEALNLIRQILTPTR